MTSSVRNLFGTPLLIGCLLATGCEDGEDTFAKPVTSVDSGTDPWGDSGDDDNCGGESSEVECSVWDQDCPAGEKCVFWGDVPSEGPNKSKCVAIACEPKEPGEACTAIGGVMEGFDDCDGTSTCWNSRWYDSESELGVCVPHCLPGSKCADEGERACALFEEFSTYWGLCMPRCSPLETPCAGLIDIGHMCLPSMYTELFVCLPRHLNEDGTVSEGAIGEDCWFYNECNPGLVCAWPDDVVGCDGQGCCTPFCDLTGENTCPGAMDGEDCVAAWADPAFPEVGVCELPEPP